MGSGQSTVPKMDALPSTENNPEEINPEEIFAYDDATLKKFIAKQVRSDNEDEVLPKLAKYLLTHQDDRTKDLKRLFAKKMLEEWTGDMKYLFAKEMLKISLIPVWDYVVKSKKRKKYFKMISRTEKFDEFLKYLLEHMHKPHSQDTFKLVKPKQYAKIFDGMYEVLADSQIVALREYFKKYCDLHNFKCLMNMNIKFWKFREILFSPEYLCFIRDLKSKDFSKFLRIATFQEIAELQVSSPDILKGRDLGNRRIDVDGYMRASKFVNKYGREEFSKRSRFTTITVGMRKDFRKLKTTGKTELLRLLVWGHNPWKMSYENIWFEDDEIYLLYDILFDDGIFIPLMLHRLVKTKRYSIIRLYLQHGYTITERDSKGKYAYEYAANGMDEKLYNQLIPARSYASKSQSQSEMTSNSASDDDCTSVCSATSAANETSAASATSVASATSAASSTRSTQSTRSKKRVTFVDNTSDAVTSNSG